MPTTYKTKIVLNGGAYNQKVGPGNEYVWDSKNSEWEKVVNSKDTVDKFLHENPPIAPEGKIFDHWVFSYKSDEDFTADFNKMKLSENKNRGYFKPVWVEETTLTLDKNSGSGQNGTAKVVFNATSVTDFTFNATKTGHTLDGFYTKDSGGKKVLNMDGSLVRGVDGWTTNDTTPKWTRKNKSEKLYAHWTQAVTHIYGYVYAGESDDGLVGATVKFVTVDKHVFEAQTGQYGFVAVDVPQSVEGKWEVFHE